LAALNHPNIAHVYGLEESANTRCIVMELIEGETLQQRLTRGAIRVEEALQIAKQTAEALEAAHERGIIHRDLKPGNIMMAADGKVKMLDFGLAKAVQDNQPASNLSNSPRLVSAASVPGVILGTASYMSPEQARGMNADPVPRQTLPEGRRNLLNSNNLYLCLHVATEVATVCDDIRMGRAESREEYCQAWCAI
jgi:serine/threonine-protein kinase